jgi:hypothetical protein
MVIFPQYPMHSDWYSVVVSTWGMYMPNPPETGELGQVGGIRKVKCLAHAAMWKRNFQFVGW